MLRSEGGAPEAELALFDPGEIELKRTGIGEVREAGYRTTAGDAKARLEALGIGELLIRDAAEAGAALAAKGYARGKPTHRLLGVLDGAEVFEGHFYDATQKAYVGLWFDMRALARDLGITGASAALQAMALYTTLSRVHPSEPVFLDTSEIMSTRRPGERSLRRVSFRHVDTLPSAMRSLAGRAPVSDGERGARTNDEIVRILIERGEPEGRLALVREILDAPEPPLRGPLADAEAWSIERSLSDGALQGAAERIDKLEQVSGRQPATIYLRARLALLRGSEPARPLAVKLSELVMSHSFCELELLAAQAWHAAGEPGRARPFLRSLLENPNAPDLLKRTAETLMQSTPAQTLPPPAVSPSAPPVTYSQPPVSAPAATVRRSTLESVASNHEPPALELDLEPLRPERPKPSAPAPLPVLTMPPFVAPASSAAPAPSAPPPTPHAPPVAMPPSAVPSVAPPTTAAAALAATPAPQKSLSPKSKRYYSSDGYFSAIDLEWEAIVPPSQPPPKLARGAATLRFYSPAQRVQSAEAPAATAAALSQPPFSQPAFSQPPKSLTPRALSARAMRAAATPELAEQLSLPRGHENVPEDGVLLRTGLDARVHFTRLSRELGRSYRERFGLELWSDLRGIETMQHKLREIFANGPPRQPAEVAEARRHGALFSEILVRTLGAEWSDIAPTELGYWAMTIPPSTRVLPFGKIARFIASIGNPRADGSDLVSYYREIERRGGVV